MLFDGRQNFLDTIAPWNIMFLPTAGNQKSVGREMRVLMKNAWNFHHSWLKMSGSWEQRSEFSEKILSPQIVPSYYRPVIVLDRIFENNMSHMTAYFDRIAFWY